MTASTSGSGAGAGSGGGGAGNSGDSGSGAGESGGQGPNGAAGLEGSCSLQVWEDRTSGLGIAVKEGTLMLGADGQARWMIVVEQTGRSDPGRAKVTALGTLDPSTLKIAPSPGGEVHSHNMKLGELTGVQRAALLGEGWSEQSYPFTDPFSPQPEEQAEGRLPMGYSRSLLIWQRR